MKPIWGLILIAALIFSLLFIYFQSTPKIDKLIDKCRDMCKQAKERGLDLSRGHCLSNNLASGWVCDVAHWPRQAVDDDPANQCQAYGKEAYAFVEVDPDCNPIRVWDGNKMQEFR